MIHLIVVAGTEDPITIPPINLNPEEKQRQYERVSSKSQEMIFKFQNLFSATRKSLREKNLSVSDLLYHVECLGFIQPTFRDAGLSPLRHQLPKLANSETVDDAMSIIKDYCSFFNYHMLKHIIDKFGSLQDKENLAVYEKDFQTYAECCVIEEPLQVGKVNKEGFSTMYVTLDDSFESCTLSHLHIFVAELRKVLKIPSDVALRLCYINRGSIKLTLQLPLFVKLDVFPLSSKQESQLADLGVLELSCEDYHFTRQENKVRLYLWACMLLRLKVQSSMEDIHDTSPINITNRNQKIFVLPVKYLILLNVRE